VAKREALNEDERRYVRGRIDEAKRSKLETARRLTRALAARSPLEVKRQTAARKAIFAACEAPATDGQDCAIIARSSGDAYLVRLGADEVRLLDLGAPSPSLSEPSDISTLLADEAGWTPFDGPSAELVATVRRLLR
jgi:hypothetical protein